MQLVVLMEIEYKKIRSSWVHQSNWNSTTPRMFTFKELKSTLGFCCKNVSLVMENASFVCIFIRLYAILLAMLKFLLSTVHRQQHYFMTNEWVLLWKCQRCDAEDVSTYGGFEPPAFGFMPNALPFEISINGAVNFDLWLWGMICAKNML